MGNRKTPLTRVLLLALGMGLGLAACADASAKAPLAIGDPVPAVWRDRPADRLTLAWVVREKDCIACQTPARRLRALQRAHGRRLTLEVLGVDVPQPMLANMLRSERLDAEAGHLTEQEYGEAFRGAPVPALYLFREGRVVDMWSGTPDEARAVAERTRRPLEDLLNELLADAGEVERTSSAGTGRPGDGRPVP